MSGFQTLDAYKKAYPLAMDIFNISKIFPKQEIYSLTDQIRRSSRSFVRILRKLTDIDFTPQTLSEY